MKNKVTVVGMGALGSQFILMCRNFAVDWKVIDFDKVEGKNLMSQYHTKMVVGANKAKAVQKSMQGLYGLRINANPHKLTALNVDELLGGSDLIVDCVDNGATRVIIQSWAKENNVPCLHGALSIDGQLGRSVWSEIFTVDFEDTEGQPTCENGEHLPFIGLTVSALAMSAQAFLEHDKRVSYQTFTNGMISL